MTPLIYATRRSALALAQCRAFVARLEQLDASAKFSELQVTTSGDRNADVPLADIGGKGLFVKEIEEALLEKRADFAVHSIKDMPGTLPPGLAIACIPKREDPRDALVAPGYCTLDALPAGARVGTSSLRRAIAIRTRRPDVLVVPMRGNLDTRLRKVDAGEFDATVLAYAGLVRLGLTARATEILSVDVSLPAIGQGALGVECRADDAPMRSRLAAVHDIETAICVEAERGVMVALNGNCRTPIAAYAERIDSGGLRLRAFVAEPDGTRLRSADVQASWPASESEAHQFGLKIGGSLK